MSCLTIVVDDFCFPLSTIRWDSKNINLYKWINDFSLCCVIWFGNLMPTDDLWKKIDHINEIYINYFDDYTHHMNISLNLLNHLLETAFSKENRKKTWRLKKGFLSFYSVCMLFCLCVYLCLCLSVAILQTSLFNIGGWHFDIDTYMWLSQNGIFYFFHFLIFFRSYSLFHFSLFSLFQGCE